MQRHSFARGLRGSYWSSRAAREAGAAPRVARDDALVSFHWLNYGPDPVALPASAFAARWEGSLAPDLSVDGALFQVRVVSSRGEKRVSRGGAEP